MNVISNGGTVCLSTHSTPIVGVDPLTIPIFNSGEANVTDVEVTVTIPAGLVYDSDTASQGTFDDITNIWSVGALSTAQDELNPETLDLCFVVTDETLAPFVITWTVTCAECPDEMPEDDSAQRTIEGIICSELSECFPLLFANLEEFDSMAEAVADLGEGQPFLASLLNIEGWSYRAVLVTPFS